MKAFRLASPRYNPRTGWGARKWGGRWNSPGNPVVYAASSLALACLEVLVHIQDTTNIPNYSFWELDIPDRFIDRWLLKFDVPRAEEDTRRIGDDWLKVISKSSEPGWLETVSRLPFIGKNIVAAQSLLRLPREPKPVMEVPSAIIQYEFNYLIAPEHVQYDQIKWSPAYPFQFDPRLLHPRR